MGQFGTEIIFSISGRGLCHVTPYIFLAYEYDRTYLQTAGARDFKIGTPLCTANVERAHR